MEIGTLVTLGYNIVCVLANIDPENLEKILAPDYKYSEKETKMLEAVQNAYLREFPGTPLPRELQLNEDSTPPYKLPKTYNFDRIKSKLGSNSIASICIKATRLIIDTVNEMNGASTGSHIKLITNKLVIHGHVNDAFRMLCVSMIGGFVELSKVNFQNINELQTADKYLRFMRSLGAATAVSNYLKEFASLELGKKVVGILAEVVDVVKEAKKVIQRQLEKTKITTQISTLDTAIGLYLTPKFDFYSLIISEAKEDRVQIGIPNFTQKDNWSPHQTWLHFLALSLTLSLGLSNQSKSCHKYLAAQSYIDDYQRFEEKLWGDAHVPSLKDWPALFALEHLRQKQTGLYTKAQGCYEDYYTLGQQLYLINLLRRGLRDFGQLTIEKGEQILSTKEARELIDNILEQMGLLITSIEGLSTKLVKWGKKHHRGLLYSKYPEGKDSQWAQNFEAIEDISETRNALLQCLKGFQIELKTRPILPTGDRPLASFDRRRIMKTVELVNAQLNAQSKLIFPTPVMPAEEVPREKVPQPIALPEPLFIQTIRAWIGQFCDNAQQEAFRILWKEICYLKKPILAFLTGGYELPVTPRHCLETKHGYLLKLQKHLGSAEPAEHLWATEGIKTLTPLTSQELRLTPTARIEAHIKHNYDQLKRQKSERYTLEDEMLNARARTLMQLLPDLSLTAARNCIRTIHECCFPPSFSYHEQTDLQAEIAVDKALKQGLNKLLGEVLDEWREGLRKVKSSSAYYKLIAEGLIRMGANPLEWLEVNGASLKESMEREEYNELFIFFTAQTEVLLSFIQYHAGYLGQTVTQLNQKWDSFINAFDEFSTSLGQCINNDSSWPWLAFKGFIDLINTIPKIVNTSPFWEAGDFLGARQERFDIWLEVIIWVSRVLNQAFIDVTKDPEYKVGMHGHQTARACANYKQRFSESWMLNTCILNNGVTQFENLEEKWRALDKGVETIAEGRVKYLHNLNNSERVASAVKDAQDARAETGAVRMEYGSVINNTANRFLTQLLQRVRAQKKLLTKDEEYEAVIALIYSDSQYAMTLATLTDAGWNEKCFRQFFEARLAEENELSKGKEEAIESPPKERGGRLGFYAQFFGNKPEVSLLPEGASTFSMSSSSTTSKN